MLLLLSLTGCVVYHPQVVDIPMLSAKNEFRIDAGISSTPGAQASFAYAVTDKYAVQVYANAGYEMHRYIQGAAGRYWVFNTNHVLGLYGGYGYGTYDIGDFLDIVYMRGNYHLPFIQCNYGKTADFSQGLEAGLGIKGGALILNILSADYQGIANLPPIDGSIIRPLIEPMGFIRFGEERLKFNLKLSTCVIPNYIFFDDQIPFVYLTIGCSANYYFSR